MTISTKHLIAPLALLAALTTVSNAAAAGPPDGSTAEQKALIAADPAFVPQHLALTDLPKPTRPAIALFNGHDLDGWDNWLGASDAMTTYAPVRGKSIGLNHDDSHVF